MSSGRSSVVRRPAERLRRSSRSSVGSTSPGCSSYGGMPGCAPKNCSSIAAADRPGRALAEQADQRGVQVAVAADHAELLDVVGIELVVVERADALPGVAPAELRQPDAGVAGERRDRVGEHLADVGPRVDRPLGAERHCRRSSARPSTIPPDSARAPRRPRRVVRGVRTSEGNCETAHVPDTASPPADLAFGAFSDDPPWVLDLAAITWAPGLDAVRAGLPTARSRCSRSVDACRRGSAWRARDRSSRDRGRRIGPLLDRRRGEPSLERASHAGCGSPPSTWARPTSSSARSSPPARGCSPRSWSSEFKQCRDQVPAERSTACGRSSRHDLGAAARGRLRARSTARRSPRRRSPRCTRRRCAPASGSSSRCSGRRSRRSSAKDLRGDGVARAAPRRPHPDRRAGQPAGAGRAVRRDDHRGARLPPRGAEHARHRPRARRARPARLRRPPPAPDARHPARAGDGAARRASSSTTSPA